MAARVKFHVVYSKKNGDWVVKRNGTIIGTQATKGPAVAFARTRALEEARATLVIHKRDGTIESERTYPRSSDPYPPKG